MERIRQWVARRGAVLGPGLIGLVVLNAAVQAWESRRDTLVAWKGGGFGMYTEPHDRNRAVWLEQADPQDGALRLWPASDLLTGFLALAGPQTGAAVRALVAEAGALRFYPRAAPADRLMRAAAAVDWPAPIWAASGAERIVVLQLRHRLAEGRIDLEPVFARAGGAAP